VISQAVMGILAALRRRSRAHPVLGSRAQLGDNRHPEDVARGPEIRALRGSRMSKIFQEPMTSLSPLHTIGNQISEVLRIHASADRKEMRDRTEEMLGMVGFPNPHRAFDMYPFRAVWRHAPACHDRNGMICRPAC